MTKMGSIIGHRIACSKRSDSGERCGVKKAMKSRGGLEQASHRIDCNGVGALRGQRHIPTKYDPNFFPFVTAVSVFG